MLVWEDEVKSTPTHALQAHSAALPVPPFEPVPALPTASLPMPVPAAPVRPASTAAMPQRVDNKAFC